MFFPENFLASKQNNETTIKASIEIYITFIKLAEAQSDIMYCFTDKIILFMVAITISEIA